MAAVFFVLSVVFVWRSFYGMRIGREVAAAASTGGPVSAVARGK